MRDLFVGAAVALLMGCSSAAPEPSQQAAPEDANDHAASDGLGDEVAADPDLAHETAPPDLGDPDISLEPMLVGSDQLAPVPSHLLFVRLLGDDLGERVEVVGILRDTPTWIDVDQDVDEEFPFWVQLLDAGGQSVFQATLREPIQMREYLAKLGLFAGGDIFTLVPDLAGFSVPIPADDRAAVAVFSRAEPDGSLVELGRAALSDSPVITPYEAHWETVRAVADPADALDITFVADGYMADEIDLFAYHVEIAVAGFLEEEPFTTYSSRINFHRVDAISEVSGAGFDCAEDQEIPGCADELKETAFGSFFPVRIAGGVVEGTDYVMFQMKQLEIRRAAALTPFDTIVVLTNTPKLGAFGLWVTSINAVNDDLANGVVHEFGHAYGLLADEYSNATDPCQQFEVTPDFPNLSDLVTDPADAKWAHWLDDDVPLPTSVTDPMWRDEVGMFQGVGGGCAHHYRPVRYCLMYSWSSHLCPVCREQVVRRFYQTYDLLPANAVVIEDGVLSVRAVSDHVVGEWSVDGEVVGDLTAVFALPDEPSDVPIDVRVRAWDPTEWVRPGVPELSEDVTAQVVWGAIR